MKLSVHGVIIVNSIFIFDETIKMQRKIAATNIIYVFKPQIETYSKCVTLRCTKIL